MEVSIHGGTPHSWMVFIWKIPNFQPQLQILGSLRRIHARLGATALLSPDWAVPKGYAATRHFNPIFEFRV